MQKACQSQINLDLKSTIGSPGGARRPHAALRRILSACQSGNWTCIYKLSARLTPAPAEPAGGVTARMDEKRPKLTPYRGFHLVETPNDDLHNSSCIYKMMPLHFSKLYRQELTS
ncbi:hypothetical protein Bphy_1815 [Paraburkholderia phymatum STM815]|uniref:Uncharacterized protein n=1 Tax=Paraburkholderia phymatum (strain DSM 17167 / CIP 108236 / LMG 21445 / STM815) TaxID=391038 RepID=B2JCJ6_PARP8|nr:hypothetical protein Bphy_1815 [Paraburkholderia phymatum STM815]